MAPQTDQDWAERVAYIDYLNSASLVGLSLFYGVFLVIFMISFILLIQQRRTLSAPRKILFGSIIFLGMAMTANFSLQVAGTLIQMSWPGRLFPSATLQAKLVAADDLSQPPRAGAWVVMPLVYIVADAMPVWRAYLMWSHSKVMKSVILLLFGLNFAVCIFQAVYLAVEELRYKSGYNEFRRSIVYATRLLFSILVNAISTSLIGYQIWVHRALIRKTH
ncbi:hypothetical protein DL96DRAFT_597831 [Flagelloscypha sp. PMI_526]|nr:hypothetical protein DL96DRAFT_597831 [Flagelloscypha sp. PMI_526]